MFTAISKFFQLFTINLDSLCKLSHIGNVRASTTLANEMKGVDLKKLQAELTALGYE